MNTSNDSEKFCGKTYIYHYLSFQRLANLLKKKENTLVSPLKWEDPFEKWRLKSIAENNKNISFNEKSWFGQCWTTSGKSDAMWKLYTNGTDGFRIRSTVKKLWESLPKEKNVGYRIAKVSYRPKRELATEIEGGEGRRKLATEIEERNENISEDDFCTKNEELNGFQYISAAFMIKRYAYEYENEVRLICYKKNEENRELFSYNIVCPSKLIDQILIHPRILPEEYPLLECVIKMLEKGNDLAGKIDIKHSKLHDLRLDSNEHE